jgi:hypothetical protein
MKFPSVLWIYGPKSFPECYISVKLSIGLKIFLIAWITLKRGYIEVVERRIKIESCSSTKNRRMTTTLYFINFFPSIFCKYSCAVGFVRINKIESKMCNSLLIVDRYFPRSYIHASVNLTRIYTNYLSISFLSYFNRSTCFTTSSWPIDNDDLGDFFSGGDFHRDHDYAVARILYENHLDLIFPVLRHSYS